MKTVRGEITSTKPISLSKASKILSKFVSTDTSASSAVSVYLSRTSESFIDLVQFHKTKSKSKSAQKGTQKSQLFPENQRDGNFGNLRENGGALDGRVGSYRENVGSGIGVIGSNEGSGKSKKNNKKGSGCVTDNESGVANGVKVDGLGSGKKRDKEVTGGVIDNVVVNSLSNVSEKNKKDNEVLSGLEVDGSGKKKNKKKKKGKEGSSGVGVDVSRKRKVEEVEEGGDIIGSEERKRKKKKRKSIQTD